MSNDLDQYGRKLSPHTELKMWTELREKMVESMARRGIASVDDLTPADRVMWDIVQSRIVKYVEQTLE